MKPPERFHQNHGYPLQKEKPMNNLTTGPVNRWRGLVFLCISLLVISLDNTVVNVALPSISNQLGGSDTDLQWIVAAYILVFAALLLTMGALGDRIGRKRVLQFGLLWFGAGSLPLGCSSSHAWRRLTPPTPPSRWPWSSLPPASDWRCPRQRRQ